MPLIKCVAANEVDWVNKNTEPLYSKVKMRPRAISRASYVAENLAGRNILPGVDAGNLTEVVVETLVSVRVSKHNEAAGCVILSQPFDLSVGCGVNGLTLVGLKVDSQMRNYSMLNGMIPTAIEQT